MRSVLVLLSLLAVTMPCAIYAADDVAARKILQAVADRNSAGFQAGQTKTTVTLTLASGKSKTWATLGRVARGKDGKLKSRVTFLEPADAVGTELLIVEQANGDAAQYLWLPKTKRLRRISGSQRNEAFMGTDFSFGDLQGHGLQAGESKRVGPETINGAPCTRIDVAMTDPDEPYSKVELWIDDRLLLARQIKYFDKAGSMVKTFVVDQVLANEPGKSTMKRFRMLNHLRNSVTLVQTLEVDTKVVLPDSLFEPDALGK